MNKLHYIFLSLMLAGSAVQAMEEQNLNERLYSAAEAGDLAEVVRLIAQGADVNYQDRDGFTPLMGSAFWDRVDVAQCLIEHGARVNAPCKTGSTALLYAVIHGSFPVIECLIHAGADVNVMENGGQQNLLALAVGSGKGDVVRYFFKNGLTLNHEAHEGEISVMRVPFYGYRGVLQCLIEAGMDVNYQDSAGQSILNLAACRGHKSTVEYLLRNGAKVNYKCEKRSALISAASNGHLAICEILCDRLMQIPNDTQRKNIYTLFNCLKTIQPISKDIRSLLKSYMIPIIEEENRENFKESIAYQEIQCIENEAVRKWLLEKYSPSDSGSWCTIC